MIDKSKLKAGDVLTHKMLGTVFVDETCILLNEIQSEASSAFVGHEGQIKEVTLSLLQHKTA